MNLLKLYDQTFVGVSRAHPDWFSADVQTAALTTVFDAGRADGIALGEQRGRAEALKEARAVLQTLALGITADEWLAIGDAIEALEKGKTT